MISVMMRWWWTPETHARGVSWISPDQQSGDKRVTNTPEITPGDGEITPDENLELLIADINILSVIAMSTTRVTLRKGSRWGSFSHAVKGPWLGFKMTMCHIQPKLSLLWNSLLPVRMFPENFAKRQESLQNEVAEQGNATILTISASSFPENEMAFLLLQSISSMTIWDFEYLILKFVTSDDNGVVRYKT